MQVAPALRSADLWQAPWIADAFDDELRERLLDALDQVPSFVDELEAAPQPSRTATPARTTCCAPPGPTTSPSSTTASGACSAVGFDLGQLLVGDVQIGRRPAATLPELEAACLPAYVEGLRAEGSRSTPPRSRGRTPCT